MPRPSGARKNQHNNRHENGLVGPGKRIVKQKSNQQLNGIVKSPAPTEPLPEPSSAVNGVPVSPISPQPPTRADDPLARTNDSSETDAPENAKRWDSANGNSMATQKSRPKSSQDVSALQIANTILRSRPACDTISLLIVLLALPSMILTIVQALFASLTLMPGTGPLSVASIIDVFQGSFGAPSVATMVWVDAAVFMVWICLWNWAQNFALDLAQIHIAITLGNGSGKSSSANTFCFALMLGLHTVRSRSVRRFVLSNLVPTNLISGTRLEEYLQYFPSDTDFGDTPTAPSKIGSLFAIHILSQALIGFIRRQVTNSQAGTASKGGKRVDTEATAGSAPENIGTDSTAAVASGTDYQPTPPPMLRDAKASGVSAKKRRRQANHVRSRQPFWAALASTKVHVLREVENKKGLPNATISQDGYNELPQSDNVWIRNVDPSSIQVEARFNHLSSDDPESNYLEGSKPLFVRINGAKWQSVQIDDVQDENAVGNWNVDINGLAPNCTYTCTFHDSVTGEEFASVMVRTPVLMDKDYSATTVSVPVQPTRPQSPTTTLKNSIASEENKLSEARKKLAQLKRQHKAGLNKADREVDSLNGRLRSGGDDNKLRQKLLQTERQIRQTEDNSTSLSSALDTLETVPENETLEWTTRKAAFEEQKRLLADATKALTDAKAAADAELGCQNTEFSSAATRKERLTSRVTKLNEQHDRIMQANADGMNEKERKEADSAAKQQDQLHREKELLDNISRLNTQLFDVQMQTNNYWREIEIMDKQDQLQRSKMILSNGPLTPEGELPGTRLQSQHSRPYAFGSFNALPVATAEAQESPFLAYASTLPNGGRPRSGTDRSIGGVSNYSEDFDDADPIPPTLQANGRKGSGSSRGKNNGSPAHGFIGGALRSPGRHSPGHLPGTTTW
jgi:ubiquitination network signaling protein AcrB